MKKTIYCTLDTETVGGASRPTGTYNYGGKIHDKDGFVYASFSILVAEKFEEIRNDDYAKKNFPLYQKYINEGKVTIVPTEADAIALIRNLCRFYGVKYVMAYNSAFDFIKTNCRELLDEFEFIDIYLMALQTITHLKKYAKFCRENALYSRSGKTLSTSAESVYAYIINDASYEEEHTAFEDACIEMEIFKACLKMHKAFTKNCHQNDCRKNKCFPRI